MGKSEIDWEKLSNELYSVIAHASAGTDMDSDDIKLAVTGCIDEFKKMLN